MTWPVSLPVVDSWALTPWWSTPRNSCGAREVMTAWMAASMLPSGGFLKPMTDEKRDTRSRAVWSVTLRAPTPLYVTSPLTYCGVSAFSGSAATGTPMAVMRHMSIRVATRPTLIRLEPSRNGSYANPFQSTSVRGFSVYVRIRISRSSPCRFRMRAMKPAYSSAATGSWMEHGPAMTAKRSSRPLTMSVMARRPARVVVAEAADSGTTVATVAGVTTTLRPVILVFTRPERSTSFARSTPSRCCTAGSRSANAASICPFTRVWTSSRWSAIRVATSRIWSAGPGSPSIVTTLHRLDEAARRLGRQPGHPPLFDDLKDVSTAGVKYADTHHSLSQDSPRSRPTPGLAPVFCGTDACYAGALTARLGSASRDLSAVIGKYARTAVIAPSTT